MRDKRITWLSAVDGDRSFQRMPTGHEIHPRCGHTDEISERKCEYFRVSVSSHITQVVLHNAALRRPSRFKHDGFARFDRQARRQRVVPVGVNGVDPETRNRAVRIYLT